MAELLAARYSREDAGAKVTIHGSQSRQVKIAGARAGAEAVPRESSKTFISTRSFTRRRSACILMKKDAYSTAKFRPMSFSTWCTTQPRRCCSTCRGARPRYDSRASKCSWSKPHGSSRSSRGSRRRAGDGEGCRRSVRIILMSKQRRGVSRRELAAAGFATPARGSCQQQSPLPKRPRCRCSRTDEAHGHSFANSRFRSQRNRLRIRP